MSRTVSSPAGRVLAVVITLAPPPTKRATTASPIPFVPPVMSTRFPANSVASFVNCEWDIIQLLFRRAGQRSRVSGCVSRTTETFTGVDFLSKVGSYYKATLHLVTMPRRPHPSADNTHEPLAKL